MRGEPMSETILQIDLIEEDTLQVDMVSNDIFVIQLYSEDVFSVEIAENRYENDYLKLKNKPKIEGVTVEGDKTFEEYTLSHISNQRLEQILV